MNKLPKYSFVFRAFLRERIRPNTKKMSNSETDPMQRYPMSRAFTLFHFFIIKAIVTHAYYDPVGICNLSRVKVYHLTLPVLHNQMPSSKLSASLSNTASNYSNGSDQHSSRWLLRYEPHSNKQAIQVFHD